MKEFKYIIKNKLGLHARPAGLLVKTATEYPCEITVINKSGKEADAKRILGIMSLCIKQGEEVIIRCNGELEEKAADALGIFLEEHF